MDEKAFKAREEHYRERMRKAGYKVTDEDMTYIRELEERIGPDPFMRVQTSLVMGMMSIALAKKRAMVSDDVLLDIAGKLAADAMLRILMDAVVGVLKVVKEHKDDGATIENVLAANYLQWHREQQAENVHLQNMLILICPEEIKE
jgi:hypothetical protein